MVNLPETVSFPSGITQLETTDPVIGGTGGKSNEQPTQLGSRTLWLRDKVNRALRFDTLKDISATAVSGTYSVLEADVNTALEIIDVGSVTDIVLPTLTSFGTADILGQPFTLHQHDHDVFRSVILNVSGSDKIFDGTNSAGYSTFKIRPGQHFTILPLAGGWYIIDKTTTIPVGSKLDAFGASAPAGYLACIGGTVSRVAYADLFTEIGTTYGVGDGSTTFTLPDTRAYFFRGLDQGAGRDPSRALGTVQQDDFKAHTHRTDMVSSLANAGSSIGGQGPAGTGSFTSSTGGTETRPKNLAVYVYIKY